MKTCPNCLYENNFESLFCQECGFKLPEKQKLKINKHHIESEEDHEFVWTCDFCGEEFLNKKSCDLHEKECDKRPIATTKNGIYQKLNNKDIDDIIFKSEKKKSHLFRNIVIIICVFFFFIFILIALASYEPNSNSATSSSDNNSQDTSNKYFTNTELNNLQLSNNKMYGNDYYEPNPSFEASLHNAGALGAKNVVIKFNFYKNKGDSVPQDTQYIIATNYIGAGDSTFLSFYIKTQYNTSGNFFWDASIYSAEK